MRFFIDLSLCCFSCCMMAAPVQHDVAHNGTARMIIVYQPSKNPKLERWDHIYKTRNTPDFAAKYLADHLKEITGATFRRIPENQWDKKTPAFLIGPTGFAKKHGIDFGRFRAEEWLYKSQGKHIILGGGDNFGPIIAINNFLEKELDCAFLAFDARHFPARKKLTLGTLNKRGEPSFSKRSIYTSVPAEPGMARKLMLFQRFNRGSIHGRDAAISSRQFSSTHSLYSFIDPDKYFKKHPEYYSMDQKGRRFCGNKKTRMGGQICFSNPDAAKVVEENLRKFIIADRKNTVRKNWPTLYTISQLDATNFMCLCPECKKITAREGSDSGLQLYFFNKIARNIAKDYPEVNIRILAYVSTEKAPKYIKPEKNIQIDWCDLYLRSDCFRPVTHPVNKKQFDILKGWMDRGIVISSVWDYWNMGGRWNFPPRIETMASVIKKDLAFYHANGCRDYFTEAEHRYYDVDYNFYELQLYLGLQLLDDITRDEKKLIDRFMKLYYGPAGSAMFKAYQKITQGVASVPVAMSSANTQRPYQTPAFVKELYTLMNNARLNLPENSPYRFRVEREMLPVLRVMLYYNNLRSGKSRAEVLKEYRTLRYRQLNYLYTPQEVKKVLPKVEKEITRVSFEFATPAPFRHLKDSEIHKFSALDFGSGMVTDPASSLKNVIRVGYSHNRKRTLEKHASPDMDTLHGKTIIGLTNMTHSKTARIDIGEDIPQDEKYHWYCMRNCDIGPQTVFWAWAWYTKCQLGKIYQDGANNRYDVWFSLKIVGPMYVYDSQKENDFFIESIILTPPGAVKDAVGNKVSTAPMTKK